jgi:hypothetical protein
MKASLRGQVEDNVLAHAPFCNWQHSSRMWYRKQLKWSLADLFNEYFHFATTIAETLFFRADIVVDLVSVSVVSRKRLLTALLITEHRVDPTIQLFGDSAALQSFPIQIHKIHRSFRPRRQCNFVDRLALDGPEVKAVRIRQKFRLKKIPESAPDSR